MLRSLLGELVRPMARRRHRTEIDHLDLATWKAAFSGADRQRREALVDELQAWIEKRPDDCDALTHAGDALARLARHEEAEDTFRRALRQNASWPAALEGLGLALLRQGHLEEANLYLESAHKHDSMNAEFMVHWGLVALEMGHLSDAAQKFQGAIDRDPKNPHAWHNLGIAAIRAGDTVRGLAHFQRAIDIKPDFGIAHSNLALAYRDAERLEKGLEHARRAVELKASSARFHVILADLLTDAGDLDHARAALDEAVARDPQEASIGIAAGKLYAAWGRHDEAEEALRQVLSNSTDNPEAAAGLGQLRLLHHDFEAGWDLYEARRRTLTSPKRQFSADEWQGESLEGKTLLVHAEQGLGDIIFFCGCLADLIPRAGHIVLETYPRLAGLLQRSFPQATVIGRDIRDPDDQWLRSVPPLDFHIPIGSLPRWLRRRSLDFRPHDGYLTPDASRVEGFRQRLKRSAGVPAVGIAWRGGLARTARLQRSVRLEDMLTALAPLGVQVVNLQHGDVADELERAYKKTGVPVSHWPEQLVDQDDAAALTHALDGVVTVCQTQAHLTGALGRPGCVLVPRHPNWRYGLSGPTVPWYPSLTMVRQVTRDRWDEPLDAAASWVRRRAAEMRAP